ncbi:hypothetical protein THICB2_640042 [Thiomonas sp. CB2]|nr:hypothetical protein THICB2_640042 [Thiomonas sp. CB2]VDY03786.1 protein of unknown function [Thiomonas sp. Bio17B3]VDY09037.1 protein of unknown function [Thiomonas sp. Sup16B3]VDY12035.1 conserved protein of unknown function [Thiomonas sp. OC7]VDY18748.1 protein of unknown function [Thiomonas sp. CB2]
MNKLQNKPTLMLWVFFVQNGHFLGCIPPKFPQNYPKLPRNVPLMGTPGVPPLAFPLAPWRISRHTHLPMLC